MGNIKLTNGSGDTVTVDKSFIFLFDEDGTPRIIGHHSSLPIQVDE